MSPAAGGFPGASCRTRAGRRHDTKLLFRGLSTTEALCNLPISAVIDHLAGLVEPVRLHYLRRPQLTDVADEMVLETAINGRADCIVTFNTRHFGPAVRFGIETIWPNEAMRRLR